MNGPVREWSRRNWLRGALVLGWTGGKGFGAGPDDVLDQIKDQGRRAAMQPFTSSSSLHFTGIGDAPNRQREDALALCEHFAEDYFAYFRGKGFTLDWPADKLPVVVLANARSYAAFEHGFIDDAVGGHFDLATNWLVTFDFGDQIRLLRPDQAEEARLNNTLTLVHETFHQLSYNTGLLDRRDDLPLCITEGLATYAETWRPAHKGMIGAINTRRRRGLELAQKEGARWIPLRTLLTEDALLDAEKTQQMAYAESSVLVARLMRDPTRLAQFRNYLRAVRVAIDPKRRLDLAVAHFGDLERLDREIRR